MTKLSSARARDFFVSAYRIVTETDDLRRAADNRKLSNRREPGPTVWHRSRYLRSIILSAVLCVGASSIANAATFTVSKIADTNDGTCDADCSLREAITAANLTVGPHTIAFNVPPGDLISGVAIINLGSALPPIIRNNVTVDGTTQPDANIGFLGTGGTVGVDALPLLTVAMPEVEIRGDGVIPFGLRIQANNTTIRGLAMIGFGETTYRGVVSLNSKTKRYDATRCQHRVSWHGRYGRR